MPRMLIVDDEPDICDCLQAFFSAKGFTVRCAYTGQEALEDLLNEPAEVMLLDIRLPDIWGIELLKLAKKLHPGVKVVMVTAVDHPQRRREAELYGAAGYITKPFDFSETTWAPVFSS